MTDYGDLNLDELQAELSKQKVLLEDIQHERAFLGKQVGMHINATEFSRLDRDIERAEEKIRTLEELIVSKSAVHPDAG